MKASETSISSRLTEERRSGSALVVVLWCVALLSVTVIGTLDSTRVELRIAKNHGDREQAYFLALAGIEKMGWKDCSDWCFPVARRGAP